MTRQVAVCGFESGNVTEWDDDVINSNPTVTTGAAMTGTYGLLIQSDGVHPSNCDDEFGYVAQRSMIWSWAVRLDSGWSSPGFNVLLGGSREAVGTSASFLVWWRASDGKLIVEARIGGVVDDTLVGPVMTPGTRYDLEMLYHGQSYSVAANRRELQVILDGTPLGTLGPNASYLGSWQRWGWGSSDVTAVTDGFHVDDVFIALGTAVGDESPIDSLFPLGPIVPNYLAPNASGTHNDGGLFTTSSGTLANSWQLIDELPFVGPPAVDYVQQNSVDTTKYVEYAFEDVTLVGDQAIAGVILRSLEDADGFGFNANAELHSICNGTDTKHHDGGPGDTISDVFPLPGAGSRVGADQWTETMLNDVTVRWGYSSNVTATPRLDALTLVAALTAVEQTEPEPPTDSPGYIGDEVYYDQLGYTEEVAS